jgi:DNA-binding response OmpR family regulator
MPSRRRTLVIAGTSELNPSARKALEQDFEIQEAKTVEDAQKVTREGKATVLLLDLEVSTDVVIELCRELSRKLAPASDRNGIRFGDIEFDVRDESLRIDTPTGPIDVSLTHHEFRLLLCLARAGGSILTRDHLIKTVWSSDVLIIGRTVDTHVCKLRKKIAASRFTIHSVYGAGYRFIEPGR